MAKFSAKQLHRAINNSSRGVSLAESFLAELNSVIERSQKVRPPSPTYKPSSLNCIRGMYYQITGASLDEELVDPGLVGICESGTDRHERIQNYVILMEEYGIDCGWIDVEEYIEIYQPPGTKVVKKDGNETKCFNSIYNMSFMCDGIIEYKDKYLILEIKTETSFKWQSRTEPAQDHITQACCYALAFGINDVIFIYENRDTCQKKPYLVHVTEQMILSRVVEKINVCNNHISKMSVPPRSTDKSHCKYCRYKTQCRKD